MTDIQIFEPDGRAIPFAVEGEGPVSLALLPEGDVGADGLGVISHYLVEEAGFHVVRIGSRAGAADVDEQVEDVVAVLDHIGVSHTWIGGHGAGGRVARAFATALVAEIAGYPGFWTLIQQTKVQIDRYRLLTLPVLGRVAEVIAEHTAIVDAIASQDPDMAEATMRLHLRRVFEDLPAVVRLSPELFDRAEPGLARMHYDLSMNV